MLRAWIIFSCLTISVLFKLFSEETDQYFRIFNGKPFLFSNHLMDKHSYVYFSMELLIAIGLAGCILIEDNTPKFFLRLFILIALLDLVHFLLWWRDPGPGWDSIKCAMFGIPLFFHEIPRLWTRYAH